MVLKKAPGPRASRPSVLEALADLVDILLGDELSTGIEVGGRDAAIDLEVKLHHRPEALQEGLLAVRGGERAGPDRLLLLRPEIEAEGADLAVLLELREGVPELRRGEAGRGEGADDILAAFDERRDRADDV